MTKGLKRQCSVEGCTAVHKSRGFCSAHYQQVKRGITVFGEVRTRVHTHGGLCTVEGCSDPIKSLGLCKKHYARQLRHGTTELSRPALICSIPECGKEAHAKGYCSTHYYRDLRTGSVDGPPPTGPYVGRRCMVSNCQSIAVSRDLCQVHYKRWQRHGDVLPTRAADWGSREKHPLYPVWDNLVKRRRNDICDRWADLWDFVADISDSRPTMKHKLAKRRADELLGPDNFYWAEPIVNVSGPEEKRNAADYMRQWRLANIDKAIDAELRTKYGIGLVEYTAMLKAQDGVCDICHRPETRVDHRIKKVSRLAVDHDHKTNVVRGLLCHGCNSALGAFGDDMGRIRAALAYLERHRPPIERNN